MARTASSVAERNNAGNKAPKKAVKTYPPAKKRLITVPARKNIDFTPRKEGEPIKEPTKVITSEGVDEKDMITFEESRKAVAEINLELLRSGDISSSAVWTCFYYDYDYRHK